MDRDELNQHLEQLLETGRYLDYCPNGLQVEGRREVTHIVSGVTASMALLEAAYAAGADTILVHHGYFWKGEPATIVGMKRQRIAYLLAHEINLFAYHLPLDAHPTLGNNAQLARVFGFTVDAHFGEQQLGVTGRPSAPLSLAQLGTQIETALKRKPLLIGDPARAIHRIGWCTGAAQSYFDAAIALGVDVFISGEISEQTVHSARENNVAYIAAGHHATERYGVQALGEHLARELGLRHSFIDCDNPV